MDLVELLFALKPLLTDAGGNWPQIAKLLEDNIELAEFEVARHYVNAAVKGSARDMLRSIDPVIRGQGVTRVGALYPRSRAAQALRPMVHDSDLTVRSRAIAVSRRLGLDDVAIPNSRAAAKAKSRWDPSGWLFGNRASSPTQSDQLAKRGLPELRDGEQLAAHLGIEPSAFKRLMRPGAGAGAPYVEFEVDKARGGTRRISAPRAELRAIQRNILSSILALLPLHDACHGFVRGRSIVTNAEPHQSAHVVIKMDLRDFFPTIHYRRVAGLFRYIGYNDTVAQLLAGLTTHRVVLPPKRVIWPGSLPQGAPTSPAIANQIARRLDNRLSGLATRVGARYTRYADDLTFSFVSEPEISVGRFCWWVDQICQQEGFIENVGKRRVLRRGNQQRITGVVVNDGMTVPRAARRRFRAILHNCKKNGVATQARGHTDFPAYLRGFAAYIKMVQPDLGARLVKDVEEILASP